MRGLLRWLAGQSLAEDIIGDLMQERARRAERSLPAAALWYARTSVALVACLAVARLIEALRATASARRTWTIGRDLRVASRALRRTPWYSVTATGVAALSLALGTTVFAIVDGVLFKPLPYASPERLVDLSGGFTRLPANGGTFGVSMPDVRAWRQAAPDVAFTAVAPGGAVSISDNDYLRNAEVDRHFFDVLGRGPLLGGFRNPDFDARSPIVPTLLTYGVWQARFGGDPGVIGRTLTDSAGSGIRVVGILPRGFLFPNALGVLDPESLSPLPDYTKLDADATARWLRVVARLPTGETPAALHGRLGAAVVDVAAHYPVLPADPSASPTRLITRGPFDDVAVRPLGESMAARAHAASAAIFGAAAVLVLIAALNLAGLAGGRAVDRRDELALRRALGATGVSLVRFVSAEHAIVIGLGAATGLAAAWLLLPMAIALIPPGFDLLKTPTVDARVAAFALLAALAATLIVSALSVREVLGSSGGASLVHGAGGTSMASRVGLRRWLIAGQVALALVMALGGALLGASLARVWDEDPGFDVDGTAKIRVNSPVNFTTAELDALTRSLARVPGVRAVGAMNELFLERAIRGSGFDTPAGVTRAGDVEEMGVTAGVFSALGFHALEGRLPAPDEFDTGRRIIVVSRTVASAYWPGRTAVGRTLVKEGQAYDVVAVVPDVRHASLDLASEGEIYSPIATRARPSVLNLVVAFEGGMALAQTLFELNERFPDVKVLRAETMRSALGQSVGRRRFQALLFLAFTAAALVIVAVGVLGVVAMAVARRTHEMGLRMALGARSSVVIGLVLREQLGHVLGGLAVGAILSAWLVRFLGDSLYQTSVYDWRAWACGVSVLLALTTAAALAPALRASRIDPVRALRTD